MIANPQTWTKFFVIRIVRLIKNTENELIRKVGTIVIAILTCRVNCLVYG